MLKHVFLALGCLGSILSLGQDAVMAPVRGTASEADAARLSGQPFSALSSGGGAILFQETFSNGFDGSNGNGAWTASDDQDGSLWIWVTPEGQGQYSDESPTGSTHPGGIYSENIGALESTTASDGWMIYDNDFFHGGAITEDNPVIYNQGALTSPMLDFSSNASVVVSWESFFRYCCEQAAPLQLEVGTTTDGVTAWISFEAHGDFIEASNHVSANPLTVSLDVSCAAAYQDSVQLRFAYRQQFAYPAYSHYFWGIDDVTVLSFQEENDLEVTQITNGDITNFWEYRVTPMEQAIGAENGGLVAGIFHKNVGTETQYDVTAMVEILDEDSVPIFTTTTTIDTIHSYGQSPTCPAALEQEIYVNTGWEPDAPGNYYLRATLSLQDPMGEATPLNNVLAKEIVFSEDVYGHDDEASLDTEFGPRDSDESAGSYAPTGWGSLFHCPNEGSGAYGVAVRFGANAGMNANGEFEPFEFAVRLYSVQDYDINNYVSFEEEYFYITSPPNPQGDPNVEVFFAFEDPIELLPVDFDAGSGTGNFYFASVLSEFTQGGQLTVLGQSGNDTDFSCAVYGRNSLGDYVWFTSFTGTPAIRLITGSVLAGCTDEMACNYDPVADVSDGSCLFVGQSCDDGLVSTLNDVVTENCQCEGEGAVYGCTDPEACNYESEANVDDGSCCVCTVDDGASGIYGAWTFSSEAGAIAIGPEPGSSEWYASPEGSLVDFQYDDRWTLTEDGQFFYDNNGGTMNPFDGYIETSMSVEPSTYSLEVEAGPNGEDVVTIHDLNTSIGETCGWMGVWDSGPQYTIVELTGTRLVLSALQQQGDCINPIGSGYFTLIFRRDIGPYDICPVPGCTDAEAVNYNPEATEDDGTCVYFATSCEFIGHPAWAGLEAGLYSDSTLWHYQGAEAYGEWVLHMPELVVEPASGSSFAVMEWSNLTMSNMPPGLQPQNMPSSMMGGEQVCVPYSGIPSEVGLYPVLVSGELTVTLFGNPYVVGPYNVVGTIEVLPNPNPIAGCTYGNAANYVVYANVDDGSCVFAGCTETEACNYQPLATVDDGTCDFGVCETVCPADVNGDGTVNTNDLLGLLGYFGLPCEE